MPESDRDSADDCKPGRGTSEPDSSTWTYYDFGTGDSYKQILAFILGYLPEADYVVGETRILQPQGDGMTLPIISIDPERIPLPLKQLDAGAIRAVQIRVEAVELDILRNAVAGVFTGLERFTYLYQAALEVAGMRQFLHICYGIPFESAIPLDRAFDQGIKPSLPDSRGVNVGGNDHLGLTRAGLPVGEPPEDADNGEHS